MRITVWSLTYIVACVLAVLPRQAIALDMVDFNISVRLYHYHREEFNFERNIRSFRLDIWHQEHRDGPVMCNTYTTSPEATEIPDEPPPATSDKPWIYVSNLTNEESEWVKDHPFAVVSTNAFTPQVLGQKYQTEHMEFVGLPTERKAERSGYASCVIALENTSMQGARVTVKLFPGESLSDKFFASASDPPKDQRFKNVRRNVPGAAITNGKKVPGRILIEVPTKDMVRWKDWKITKIDWD